MHVIADRSARARTALAGACFALMGMTAVQPAAAGPDPTWIEQLGTSTFDQFRAVTVDRSGNIVAAGNVNYVDPWVVKFDTTGTVLWQSRLTRSDFHYATGAATDGAGNVFVSIYTSYPHDGYVVKYRPSGGTPLWTKKIGTTSSDFSLAVAADSAGNSYVAGYTRGKLGDQKFGASSDEDAWVAKLNPAGTVLWIRQLGTDQSDEANGVAVDRSGNVYIVGTTWGPLGGPDPQNTGRAAFVAKYNSAGTWQWTKQVAKTGTAAGVVYGNAIAVDGSGNVVIGGTVIGRVVPGPYNGFDVWLAKYTPAGNRSWIRQYGGSQGEYGNGIATDPAGNILVAGRRYGPRTGDGTETLVLKYNAGGTLLWTSLLDAADDDIGNAVATDRSGNVFVAGGTEGDLAAPNLGRDDAFLAKFPPQ